MQSAIGFSAPGFDHFTLVPSCKVHNQALESIILGLLVAKAVQLDPSQLTGLIKRRPLILFTLVMSDSGNMLKIGFPLINLIGVSALVLSVATVSSSMGTFACFSLLAPFNEFVEARNFRQFLFHCLSGDHLLDVLLHKTVDVV